MVEELIEAQQYSKALEMLRDVNDEKTRYLRLVCLNALGEYERAKMEGEFAKANAKDTYYDVVALYVNALKECEEFEKAIDILIEELSMPYLPFEFDSLFNAAYDELLLAKQEANQSLEIKQTVFSTEQIGIILSKDEVNEDLLYMAIDQLQQLNIRLLIPIIREFLLSKTHHPFAKTLILEILIDQQVDDEFEVYKNGEIYSFYPSESTLVLEQMCYEGIASYLERVLENDNPSLLEQCIDYLEYSLYAFYPMYIYDEQYAIYASAIHYYVATLQGYEVNKYDFEVDYNVNVREMEEVVLALKQIEC